MGLWEEELVALWQRRSTQNRFRRMRWVSIFLDKHSLHSFCFVLSRNKFPTCTLKRFLNFWICLQLMLRCLHVKGFYVMVPDWDLSISEQRVTYQHLGKLEALPAVSYMSQRGHQRRTLAKEFVICVWGGKKRISEQVLNIFHMRTSDLAHVGSKRCIRFCLGGQNLTWYLAFPSTGKKPVVFSAWICGIFFIWAFANILLQILLWWLLNRIYCQEVPWKTNSNQWLMSTSPSVGQIASRCGLLRLAVTLCFFPRDQLHQLANGTRVLAVQLWCCFSNTTAPNSSRARVMMSSFCW